MLSEIKKLPFLVVGISNVGELPEPIRTLLEPDLLYGTKKCFEHFGPQTLKDKKGAAPRRHLALWVFWEF